MINPVLKLAKIVGTATRDTWSQVHSFFPTEEEKKKKRGSLLAVLSLSGLGEGVEAVAAGREVIARIHEEYFGNLKGKALERLKRAVEKVVAEAEPPIKIEIVAAAILDQFLYLAIAGEGQAVIQREGKRGTILAGSDKIEAASGFLVEGDLFLLGTASFFNLVGEGVLRAALENDSPQEAVENLAPIVHGREAGGGEAAVMVKVKELEEKKRVESEEAGPLPVSMSKPKRLTPEVFKKTTKLDFASARAKINSRLKKMAALIQSRLGKRAIYLAKEKPKRQTKTIFTVALVLFLLLGASVILGMRQRSRLARQEKTGNLLDQARSKVDEGKALQDLNPPRSRQLLLEAKDLIEKMENELGENSQLASFKQELESLLASVLREREIEKAPVFLDLTLVKEGASGEKMAVSGEQMMILDQKGASVYGVGISQKTSQILGGGKLFEGATQIAAFGNKVFVLTSKGVVEIDKATNKQTLRVEADEEWEEIVDLFAYGANLYLLDQKGVIWKYPAIEGGLGARQRWLRGESQPDFADAVSMAINGSIWVLKSDGIILKFTQGFGDAFGVAGLDKPFSNPMAIYTDDEQEKVYVLDQGNLRVVVLAKSGEYDSAYIWPGISGVSDLVVSESEKKTLLLSGSRIYEIGIK